MLVFFWSNQHTHISILPSTQQLFMQSRTAEQCPVSVQAAAAVALVGTISQSAQGDTQCLPLTSLFIVSHTIVGWRRQGYANG